RQPAQTRENERLPIVKTTPEWLTCLGSSVQNRSLCMEARSAHVFLALLVRQQDALPLIYRTINSDQLSEARSSILATHESPDDRENLVNEFSRVDILNAGSFNEPRSSGSEDNCARRASKVHQRSSR